MINYLKKKSKRLCCQNNKLEFINKQTNKKTIPQDTRSNKNKIARKAKKKRKIGQHIHER